MNPIVLFILVLLVVIFSISTLIFLLVRFLMRHPSTSPLSEFEAEMSRSSAFHRQLQYLFNLQESGLDQAIIDALPVFVYKEIIGLREPFDCAICLSEFSQQDKLRLLPLCSHAFHTDCIDKWLSSNSTCPICRGTLLTENPVLEDPREEDVERQVFSVRLGKFRSSNESGHVVTKDGETSSSDLGARRCYSMGSYKYIEANLEMHVALCPRRGNASYELGLEEKKKMSLISKGESFSISKIWQWSEKDKFSSSSDFHAT